MTLLAASLYGVLHALTPFISTDLPLLAAASPITGPVIGVQDDGPLDCPIHQWVIEHCTPLPDDQEEEMRRLLESLGYYNSAVYTLGSTIFIVTVVSFTECPKVTVL